MNNLDMFFNTREKRSCFMSMIYYGIMLLVFFTHFMLALVLLNTQSYEEIFQLVEQPFVQLSLLGKLTLQLMSLVNFDLLLIVRKLFSAFSWIEFFFLLMLIGFLFSKTENRLERQRRNVNLFNFGCFVLLSILLLICAMMALGSSSLSRAFQFVHCFAWFALAICGGLVLTNGFGLAKLLIFDYPRAMKVEVEEIEEVIEKDNK